MNENIHHVEIEIRDYGKMTLEKLPGILEEYRKEAEKA